MSLSIGSSGVNYTMLDEIWDNYKHPKQNNTFSNTGYDAFNDYDYNERVRDNNPDAHGQAILANKRPKPIQQPGSGPVFEGFQAGPMDHPSTSKPNMQNMYDHRPYDKDDMYSPVDTYNHTRSSCDEYIEHVEHCRHCYEELRKRMLEENKRLGIGYGWNFPPKNVIDLVLMIIGGAFILFTLDVFMSFARKHRN